MDMLRDAEPGAGVPASTVQDEDDLLGRPGSHLVRKGGELRLARIAAQLCGVECEHRARPRHQWPDPADNVAFEVVLVVSVSDAVGALQSGGFLCPRGGNDYEYKPVPDVFQGVAHPHP